MNIGHFGGALLPELMTGYGQLEEVPDDGIALIFAGRGLDEKIVIGQVPDFAFQQRRRHSELLRDLMDGKRLVISRVNDILRQGASKKIVGFAQSAGRTGMAHFPHADRIDTQSSCCAHTFHPLS